MSKRERLSEVVENEVALSKRVTHGTADLGSFREHLAAVNPADPRLQAAALEDDDQYYLWVFNQVSRSRNFENGFPNTLALGVYRDYMALFNDPLDADELVLLQAIDDAYVRAMIKSRSSDG